MRKILLVGSGRMAQNLIYWTSLSERNFDLITWNRKFNSFDQLKDDINQAVIIWLAISDSSLKTFYQRHLQNFAGQVVHFSGAFHDQAMVAAHPLMSFPAELMEPKIYEQIHFVITGAKDLTEILPGFGNSFSILNDSHKPFYHSLCVVAGNFPQLLWSEVYPDFQKLNVPIEAVDVYIQQVTTNFLQLKSQSLTGPLIRNDKATIEMNLKSLSGSKLKKIYESFVEVFRK